MAESTLQYLSGRGWLVFSGGQTAGSPIRAQALSRARAYGETAYISTADDGGDALMDDLEDLGARAGYFIDLAFDTPETITESLETASLVVVEAGDSIDTLYQALGGAALAGIQSAYERGGVILIEGLAINLFGRWIVSDEGHLLDGFDWVKNAFIEPQSTGADDSRAVRAVLNEIAEAVAINIDAGAAIALGADGQVEVWGDQQSVTISLGRQYSGK